MGKYIICLGEVEISVLGVWQDIPPQGTGPTTGGREKSCSHRCGRRWYLQCSRGGRPWAKLPWDLNLDRVYDKQANLLVELSGRKD